MKKMVCKRGRQNQLHILEQAGSHVKILDSQVFPRPKSAALKKLEHVQKAAT